MLDQQEVWFQHQQFLTWLYFGKCLNKPFQVKNLKKFPLTTADYVSVQNGSPPENSGWGNRYIDVRFMRRSHPLPDQLPGEHTAAQGLPAIS